MSAPLLTVSASPHFMGRATVRGMHVDTLIALLPALLAGFYYFGAPAVITVALAAAAAVIAEFACVKLTKMPNRVSDLHALVMGVMMGMILPPGCPMWLPVVGSFLAIALAKMIFGGIGGYPINPVIIAWAALSLSWPDHMQAFFAPFGAETAQTMLMKTKADLAFMAKADLGAMWLGKVPGSIGVTSGLALLAGGIYLIIRRVISWRIPVAVIVGVILMTLIASYADPAFAKLKLAGFSAHLRLADFQLAAGGMMMAAFFLATEPVSSPVTPCGMLVYGLAVGALAVIIRLWGAYSEGVYYAVLAISAATPLFDRMRKPVFGKPQRDW